MLETPPQAQRPGGYALRRAVIKERAGSRVAAIGPALVGSAEPKLPRSPVPPAPAGAAFIRVSEARLYPTKAEGGESGRRAQYLLDILGTTDRLSPLCPLIS